LRVDRIGLPILDIASGKRGVYALGAERIALAGGLGEPLRPYLPPEVEGRLVAPRRDAVDGAILLAGGTLADDASCP
jgi:glucosamine kinase